MSKQKQRGFANLNHKLFFGLLFFCLTLLIYGTCYLFINGGINYYSVSSSFENIVPYCIVVGILGYFIGYILDNPKRRKMLESNDIIERMMKESMNNSSVDLTDIPDEERPVQENVSTETTFDLPSELNIRVNTEADT